MDNISTSSGISGDSADKDETPRARGVMLALSSFRHSDGATELAIEKAAEGRELIIVYVVDVNLARYFIETDIGLYPELKQRCEKELLREHEQEGKEFIGSIRKKAETLGITVRTYVSIGRFVLECLKVLEKEKPQVIFTTWSRRPGWVRRFLRSPVDHLIAQAGCPVIEA